MRNVMVQLFTLRSSLFTFHLSLFTLLASSFVLSSCNDWLDVKPNNEQVTDDYWQSKEDVEAVIASGYYYMRTCVPNYIKWGELRGGTFYSSNAADNKLQDFNLTPEYALCDYSSVYKVINMANSVINYAPSVKDRDNTYYDAVMNSHLCEAYFQRAYNYLILAKNYKEVPLILKAYVDDNESFDIAKTTEDSIVMQVKQDCLTALGTGAAKGTYEVDWQTKGRVTKWALYALMADACLWSEDYDECIKYCDLILNATDNFRPAFMKNTNDWYNIFSAGNTNESIFELNWSYALNQETNNFASLWSQSSGSRLRFTNVATEKLKRETQELIENGMVADGRMGRMLLSTYVPESGTLIGWSTSNTPYMWKYNGTDVQDITGGVRAYQDANFIIYRVAEIILIKAQAEIMKGNYREAVELINRIRNRAGLGYFNDIDTNAEGADIQISQLDEFTLLEEVLNQKQMELVGEGKRWYDLLWFGRIGNNKYRQQFIDAVVEGNQTTNQSWVQSVLQDKNAWYMPLPQADIEHNSLLVQNPYYASGN